MSKQWQLHWSLASFSTIFSLLLFFSFTKAQGARSQCHRSCGGVETPYPFGFSSDCPIQLNCTNELPSIKGFNVQSASISKSGKFKIILPRNCSRSLTELRPLYGSNFAPSSRNAILLHDCPYRHSCKLSSINVSTSFDSAPCGSNNNVSCYNNESIHNFFDYEKVATTTGCKYLLTSISSNDSDSGALLDVQVLEMVWWIPGDNCRCSKDTNCSILNTLDGKGFRCQCKDGMIGDGYLAGEGCRKDCDFGNWLSGSCGGAGRRAIIVGGTVALVAVVAVTIVVFRVRRRLDSKPRGYTKKNSSELSIPVYPYKVIARATDGFSDKHKLGNGAYGTVYAGKLSNETWVAIKRSKDSDSGAVEQFMNEIEIISSVSHPNLVQLLGCCIDQGEQILVYEFMPNGTLYEHLQKNRGSGNGLSWTSRLAIAAETAQAIAHLHSVIDPPIYHRDIKSSNILLDWSLRPKLADFGLSRLGRAELSHISTAPQGTLGYLDPQYHQNFHLSDRSDVYSFGVVLAEIITSLKVVDFSRPPNEVSLAALAADKIGKGKVLEIVDAGINLHGDSWTLFTVNKVAELTFRCLAYDRDSRPPMTEVAAELERIRLSKPESSKNLNWSSSSWKGSYRSSPSIGNDDDPLPSAHLSPRGARSFRSFCSNSMHFQL